MPANSWPENDSCNELWSDIAAAAEENDQPAGRTLAIPQSWYQDRRLKAAAVLTVVWSGTIALHLFSWGIWLVLALTGVMAIHAVRVLRARPVSCPVPLSDDTRDSWPYVSLVVAAKK
jgi:1,2-diacylglycerol 3-beta-glucosyltransferase